MARRGVLSLALLLGSCWCSLGENPPCDPKVFGGVSLAQFIEDKKCDVDEKLLKLFTDDNSFKAMLGKLGANVLCIEFVEVFNMAPENACTYDNLAHIPSEDFCENSKALDVLVQANNSNVFDGHDRVVEVVNFVFQYCNIMCNDSTGSNELCWAFGEYVKFVMKHHMTTPPTTTTVSPTTTDTPATPHPTVPSFLKSFGQDSNSKEALHETDKQEDGTNTEDGTDKDHDEDSGNVNSGVKLDNNNASTTVEESKTSTEESPSVPQLSPLPNKINVAVNDKLEVPPSSSSNEGPLPGVQQPEIPPLQPVDNPDEQHTKVDVDNINQHSNVSDNPDHHLDNSDQHPNNSDQYVNNLDQHPNISDQNVDNLDQNSVEDLDNLPSDSSGDPINNDLGHFEHNLQESNDEDKSTGKDDQEGSKDGIDAGKDDKGVSKGNAGSKDRVDYEYDDDDDDDDGYSYWHFTAVLLFILFLGVGTYLATLNRKKIRESVSTYMNKRKRRKEYKPVNTMEAGLS